MVGRWLSFWDCIFLGAMLNFRGVSLKFMASIKIPTNIKSAKKIHLKNIGRYTVHPLKPVWRGKSSSIIHPPPFLGSMLVFGGVPLRGSEVMLSTQAPWPVMMWTMVKWKTYTETNLFLEDSSSLSWGNKTETINHIKSPYLYLWWQDQHALKFQFLRFCHTMLRGVVNTLECCNCLTYCGFGRAVAT